jgi:hypothetical protein
MALAFALACAGCGGPSLAGLAASTQGRNIAVVSLSINDYRGSLQGWNSTLTSPLMTENAATMVTTLEQQLAPSWNVIPAVSFVGRPDYQSLAGPPRNVAVPIFFSGAMPLFGMDRSDMVAARIPPATAQSLAAMLGADLLVVAYAEWGVATGGFVPTSKALSKNVISIYDASGAQVYHGRRDVRGQRTLGAFGHVVVDENSIGEWVNAFHEGVGQLLSR